MGSMHCIMYDVWHLTRICAYILVWPMLSLKCIFLLLSLHERLYVWFLRPRLFWHGSNSSRTSQAQVPCWIRHYIKPWQVFCDCASLTQAYALKRKVTLIRSRWTAESLVASMFLRKCLPMLMFKGLQNHLSCACSGSLCDWCCGPQGKHAQRSCSLFFIWQDSVHVDHARVHFLGAVCVRMDLNSVKEVHMIMLVQTRMPTSPCTPTLTVIWAHLIFNCTTTMCALAWWCIGMICTQATHCCCIFYWGGIHRYLEHLQGRSVALLFMKEFMHVAVRMHTFVDHQGYVDGRQSSHLKDTQLCCTSNTTWYETIPTKVSSNWATFVLSTALQIF